MLEVIPQSASRAAALHAAAFLLLGALLPSDAHGATSGVLDAARCAAADNTQQLMATMDRTINGEAGLPAYLALFSESVEAWGLVPGAAVDREGLASHYSPVFSNFDQSVLVSDEIIVAERSAAQRYHAMFFLAGEFDGVTATAQKTFIRGSTFFQFDETGLIRRRWSNHDHGYRLQQLMGTEQARVEGDDLSLLLNGPGLPEAEVLATLENMRLDFNRMADGRGRYSAISGYLAPSLEERHQLLERLSAFWQVVPDALLTFDAVISAWSMAAVRWRVSGSLRAAVPGLPSPGNVMYIGGETFLTFDEAGQVTEVKEGCVRWQQGY